jgi:hypothetical protein
VGLTCGLDDGKLDIYRILVGKLNEVCLFGNLRHSWVDNMKMKFTRMSCEDVNLVEVKHLLITLFTARGGVFLFGFSKKTVF